MQLRRQTQNRPVLTSPRTAAQLYDIESDDFYTPQPATPVAALNLSRETEARSGVTPAKINAPNTRQPRPAPRNTSASRHGAILWCGLGFALGIAFWHVIGFWSFIASVVLPAPSERDLTVQRPVTQASAPQRSANPARATRAMPQTANANTVPAGQPAMAPAVPALAWGTTVVLSETAAPTPLTQPKSD